MSSKVRLAFFFALIVTLYLISVVWPHVGRPLYLDALGLPLVILAGCWIYWMERKQIQVVWVQLLNLGLAVTFGDQILRRLEGYSPTFITGLRLVDLVAFLTTSVLLWRYWRRRKHT